MPPIDAKRILAKVNSDVKKQRVTLYLDQGQYKEFKKAIGSASISQVVDELIREFVESAKRR